MAASTLPAMKTSPKVIFFTDFDGTITMTDSNDYLTDNYGFGVAERRRLNIEILEERMTFRDGFQKMLESWTLPLPECIRILTENIKLDPGFKTFYAWALEHNVPVIVLSGGMEPIIRALLVHLIGESADRIEIISNDVVDRPGTSRDQAKGWEIKFHDDSGFGHDKSLAIRPYANLPASTRSTLLYAGDGVSDLSAARETDLLFAKKGHDLVTYCEREDVPFTVFEDWSSILATTKDIYDGKITVKAVAAEGLKGVDKGTPT